MAANLTTNVRGISGSSTSTLCVCICEEARQHPIFLYIPAKMPNHLWCWQGQAPTTWMWTEQCIDTNIGDQVLDNMASERPATMNTLLPWM